MLSGTSFTTTTNPYPFRTTQKSAERCINRYFEGRRGDPLSASVVALNPNNKALVGLALFVLKSKQRAHLDLLYVRSPFQRQGIATAMVHHGINCLIKTGCEELSSAYHICNNRSRHWHHQLGFQDICDRYYAQIKLGWLKHETWRRGKLGMLEGLEALCEEREQLQSQVEAAYRERFSLSE